MPEETEETLCEIRGNVRGNEGKYVGNSRLQGFLRHLVTSFQTASYMDETTQKCRAISIAFPAHFYLWIDQEYQPEARWQWAQDVHVSTWIYSAIYLIYSDIPEFIHQQIIDELIGGKLGLSQIIKTKQVFIVCDWKEDTSVEEGERKAKATKFIISYLWLW